MPSRTTQRVLAVVALGGALGGLGRYLLAEAWPSPPGDFPTATLVTNAVGCALIGVLMVLVTDVFTPHPLARPFLGTGVLGGFTTFSTYTVGVRSLLAGGHYVTGAGYLVATPVTALLAVWLTAAGARRLLLWRNS